MISGTVVRVIAAIVAAVFFVGIWATTGIPNPTFLRFFSVAVLVVTLALALWDRFLWRTWPAQQIPDVVRDLSGTWMAELESFWTDPATGQRPSVKRVYVVIRQTSTTASVTLISNESRSKSSTARVVREDGSWLLHYIYTNEPDVSVVAHSPIHHGSGVLAVVGTPARRIAGSYWTDRDTKGQLRLIQRVRKFGEDFEDCAELFAS